MNLFYYVSHFAVGLVKASKKDISMWVDSDINLGRAKEGTTRSPRTINQQHKRALSGTIFYLVTFNTVPNIFLFRITNNH
jgi:hypothetical protein